MLLQLLLAAYPGDCLLSIGCRTDRRHDWQTWHILGTQNACPWAEIKNRWVPTLSCLRVHKPSQWESAEILNTQVSKYAAAQAAPVTQMSTVTRTHIDNAASFQLSRNLGHFLKYFFTQISTGLGVGFTRNYSGINVPELWHFSFNYSICVVQHVTV